MNKSNQLEKRKYPGWPNNNIWPSLCEWERDIEPTKVPLGQGLFYSDIGFPKIRFSPPHPEYVKKWRREKNETVKITAEYFGLTEVQVLEACR
jgi:hypothetical protein